MASAMAGIKPIMLYMAGKAWAVKKLLKETAGLGGSANLGRSIDTE